MNSLINLNVHIVIINSNLYNNYKHFTNAILIKTTLMNVMKTSNNFKEIYNGNNKHKNNNTYNRDLNQSVSNRGCIFIKRLL